MPSKTAYLDKDPPLMFTGIQILEPRIFEYIPRRVFSHSVTDVYPQALAKGEVIAVHVAHENWYELSTIPRYRDISLILLAERGESLSMGKDCEVSTEAHVTESILWDGVRVERGAEVKRCIIGDKVTIGAGEVFADAAIVCASLVRGKTPPAKALKGHFQGENFVVPLAE
jgi:NDP-sugar pyrophosphorylase family protein